jgi:asparagine synthase (glutamine-hydrolysing)
VFVAFASSRQDKVDARTELWKACLPNRSIVVRPDAHFAAAYTDDLWYRPCVIGDVWLDDGSTGLPGVALSGRQAMDFVVQQYTKNGVDGFTALSGEFSLALWDPERRAALAVRDPLGTRPLFAATGDGDLTISDEADGIGIDNGFDLHFIAEFLATAHQSPKRTIWRGVAPVQPGTVMVWQQSAISERRLWSLGALERPRAEPQEVAIEIRRLVTRAVQCHLGKNQGTWADLSGGIDSSSVVCTAASLARRGVAVPLRGTITFEDSLGGHEADFVDDVLREYPELNHKRIIDAYPWRDDGNPPPRTPQPERDFPFYARERMVSQTMRHAGADVLLSGVGPDCYLSIGIGHATDMVWEGRVKTAARELAIWSRRTRRNFWRTIFDEVVIPLAPASVRQAYVSLHARPPKWIQRRFDRDYFVSTYLPKASLVQCPRGQRRNTLLGWRLADISASLYGWRRDPGYRVRHPLLYRPLVEFCLSLPSSLQNDLRTPKLPFRLGMEGVVPSRLLWRSSKGTRLNSRIIWAMARRAPAILALLRQPLLADLGCIEPTPLRAAVEDYVAGKGSAAGLLPVYAALSLESWLRVRVDGVLP